MTEEEKVKELRHACDNYKQTLNALKALAHEFLWDDETHCVIDDGKASIGRRMDTSSSNRVCKTTQVTPDLVLCVSDHGVLAEAKMALPKDISVRQRQLREIQKYDDELFGWDTVSGRVTGHDIVLIVHHFQGNQVGNDLKDLSQKGEFHFARKLSVVRFCIVEEAQTWLSLELAYGSLTQTDKENKLRKPLAIALEHIIANQLFSHIELYDADPPMPLFMYLIHRNCLAGHYFEVCGCGIHGFAVIASIMF